MVPMVLNGALSQLSSSVVSGIAQEHAVSFGTASKAHEMIQWISFPNNMPTPAQEAVDDIRSVFGGEAVDDSLSRDSSLSARLFLEPNSMDAPRELLLSVLDVVPSQLEGAEGPLADHLDSFYPSSADDVQGIEGVLENLGYSAEGMRYDRAASSGQGSKGRAEKVALLWKHHFAVQQESNPERGFLRDADMLTSRFADREMGFDTVVHLMDGLYRVDHQFVGGGAFVSVLKGMEGQTPKVLCRGTATRYSATGGYLSGLNDINEQIGQLGVQSIWTSLKDYLDSANITHVEIYGKSLGGGHAQVLTVLLEGHGITVDHLVTSGSVGGGAEVNSILRSEILPKREGPLKVTVLRNAGEHDRGEVDYIPFLGGEHLGAGATSQEVDATVYYLAPENQTLELPSQDQSLFQLGRRLMSSFKRAHLRQTTWDDFSWTRIDDYQQTQQHLGLGETLEPYRSSFSGVISRILPQSLQHQPFAEYFRHNR